MKALIISAAFALALVGAGVTTSAVTTTPAEAAAIVVHTGHGAVVVRGRAHWRRVHHHVRYCRVWRRHGVCRAWGRHWVWVRVRV